MYLCTCMLYICMNMIIIMCDEVNLIKSQSE